MTSRTHSGGSRSDSHSGTNSKRNKSFAGNSTRTRHTPLILASRYANATYTVDTGEPLREPPDAHFRRVMVFRAERNHVPWIALRRSSGRIFYALITEVRPHDWTP